MKFLVDANLSPRLAHLLQGAGHEAAHVAEELGPSAPDDVVMGWARERQCVLISADTDFGELHARGGTRKPSVVLFRALGHRRPEEQFSLLAANVPTVAKDLEKGAIVVMEAGRIRLRRLPL